PSDDVSVGPRLRGGELEPPAHLRRFLLDELVGQRDHAIEVGEVLRMSERKHEEQLLPVRAQLRELTARDPVESQRERLRVLREHPGGSAMDGTRELVQEDDEAEPRAWPLRPAVAARRAPPAPAAAETVR